MAKAITSLVSASAIYGFGSVASKFIGFFLLPVFTAYMMPPEYGLFETFNVMLFLLTTIGSLGMDSAMMRFYYDTADHRQRSRIVSTALFLSLGAACIIALIGGLITPALGLLLFQNESHRSILLITMATVVVSVVNTIQLSLFQTQNKPGRYSILTFIRFTSMYGLSIVFLMQGMSVFGLMMAQFLAYAISVILGFGLVHPPFRVTFSISQAKEMLRFSAPLIAGSVSIWLLSSSDRFFLLRLSNLGELGLYSLGSRLASVVLLAVTAFQMAWPQFILSRTNEHNSLSTNARVLTYYLFVGTLLVISITLFAPEILRLLATSSYQGAESVVFLISCSYLFYGCYVVFGIILSVTKKTFSIVPITIPPFVVSVTVNYYLIPRLGGMGSAIASVAAYFLMAVLAYVFANRLLKIRYEWDRILKMVVMTGVVLETGRHINTDSLVTALSLKFLLLGGYGTGLALLGFFTKEERLMLSGVFRRTHRSSSSE